VKTNCCVERLRIMQYQLQRLSRARCHDVLLDVYIDRLQNDSEENIQTIPTIGFNVEVLQYKNIKFQVSMFCITASIMLALLCCAHSGLGLGRTNIDSALLEMLLSKYGRHYICSRLLRHRTIRHCKARVDGHA
jgi:hypothetical protein